MKKFAVFDIDGTLFRWQLFHEVVFELIESGHIPKQAKKQIDTEMTKWRNREHRHAFKSYELALVNAFLPHLPGLKVSQLEEVADKVLSRSGSQVHTYTRDLIESLRRQGYTLVALSGSQDEVIQRFAKIWKFDIAAGQLHEVKDGTYTGKLENNVLLVDDKGAFLKQIVKDHNLDWKGSIGVGDSLSDAAMLKLVETPIAFNPDEPLFKVAQTHGWRVVIERKNMVYQLEQQHGSYVLAQTNAE